MNSGNSCNFYKITGMKKVFLIITLLVSVTVAAAQNKQHKIVYDLNSADTAVQSSVLRQFNNVLKVAPNTQLEVVCHGPAIYMLVKSKIFFEEKINELKEKGNVTFKVCANSMKRLNVDKSELIALAEIVPVAILELSEKQIKGWSYIKAGH
jgi:uncharacterized protein